MCVISNWESQIHQRGGFPSESLSSKLQTLYVLFLDGSYAKWMRANLIQLSMLMSLSANSLPSVILATTLTIRNYNNIYAHWHMLEMWREAPQHNTPKYIWCYRLQSHTYQWTSMWQCAYPADCPFTYECGSAAHNSLNIHPTKVSSNHVKGETNLPAIPVRTG